MAMFALLQFMGVTFPPESVWIVMEHMERGSGPCKFAEQVFVFKTMLWYVMAHQSPCNLT